MKSEALITNLKYVIKEVGFNYKTCIQTYWNTHTYYVSKTYWNTQVQYEIK